MMTSQIHLEPLFARHETFAPRVGWFKKIHDGIKENPEVFTAEDATLILGVGKNMVRSMRFWAGAAGLVTPPRPGRKERTALTHLAETIFDDRGWDPYIENPSTLWLLHWKLLSNGCQLPVWHYAFTDWIGAEFTVDGLTSDAVKAMPTLYGFERRIAQNSVRRDVECLVHTYARRAAEKLLLDDSIACPFRGLGLLEPTPGRTGVFRFHVGPKPSLHDDMVLFAALDFSAVHTNGAKSVSVGRLSRSPMSPGRVFKLDEDAVLEALKRAARNRPGVTLVDTAGVSALQFQTNPEGLALDVLNIHFAGKAQLTHLRDQRDLLVEAAQEAYA